MSAIKSGSKESRSGLGFKPSKLVDFCESTVKHRAELSCHFHDSRASGYERQSIASVLDDDRMNLT